MRRARMLPVAAVCAAVWLPLSARAQSAVAENKSAWNIIPAYVPVAAPAAANDAARVLEQGTPGSFTLSRATEAMAHLIVGRSVTLSSTHRLTRVYVTNPAVLYTYTATPNEVLVTSKQPGISSVVLWDEAGGSQSYLFSSELDVDGLRESLHGAMPTEPIVVSGQEGHVVLSGSVSTPLLYDAAGKMAALYSKDVTNAIIVNSASTKQVQLKVRILEVDRSKLDQFAFNFFSAGGKNLAATTTTQLPSTLTASASGSASSGTGSTSSVGNNTVSISNPLNFLLYSSQLNVGATLQDLESRQVLQILAEPTITTLSGQRTNFLAGGEFPFPVIQGVTGGGLASVTIQFRPYGVKLEFTPVVNVDGTIQLSVAPEVSALDYTNAVSISGYTIPALSTRRAETQVVLKNDQSFAISGLLDQRTTDSLSSTPGISSIPLLGKLFKSKSINHSRTELVVMVTPTIVDPLGEGVAPLPDPKLAVPLLNPSEFDSRLPTVHPN